MNIRDDRQAGRGFSLASTTAAVMALSFMAASPRAEAYVPGVSEAWDCAQAVGKGLWVGTELGVKALGFVSGQPQCIAKFGDIPSIAGMAAVVGIANAGVLPKHQPACEDLIYEVAASPIATGLAAIPILPTPLKNQLYEIAKGNLKGETIKIIPGLEFATGALSCGCGLTDAGLTVDTVKQVMGVADDIGNQCGGPVWDGAKKIVGAAIGVLLNPGDAILDGVNALGDFFSGESKNMSTPAYFAIYFASDVSYYAGYLSEFRDYTPKGSDYYWPNPEKSTWGSVAGKEAACVDYFKNHTLAEDHAIKLCADMVQGTQRTSDPTFVENGLLQRVQQRLFEYAVVEAVRYRQQGLMNGPALQLDVPPDVPPQYFGNLRPPAVGKVFGYIHNVNHTEGAQFAATTVGSKALRMWDQLKPKGPGNAANFNPQSAGNIARQQAQQAVKMAEQSIGNIEAAIRLEAQLMVPGAVAYGRKMVAQSKALSDSIAQGRAEAEKLEMAKAQGKCGYAKGQAAWAQCHKAVAQTILDCRTQSYQWLTTGGDFESSKYKNGDAAIRASCGKELAGHYAAAPNAIAYNEYQFGKGGGNKLLNATGLVAQRSLAKGLKLTPNPVIKMIDPRLGAGVGAGAQRGDYRRGSAGAAANGNTAVQNYDRRNAPGNVGTQVAPRVEQRRDIGGSAGNGNTAVQNYDPRNAPGNVGTQVAPPFEQQRDIDATPPEPNPAAQCAAIHNTADRLRCEQAATGQPTAQPPRGNRIPPMRR
ncbi:MAG: hypothetical protein V4709_12715 [Pseudomonadota bacterium]